MSTNNWDVHVQVKENFDRFISCKNTIDDIHVRLRRTEAEASSTVAVMQVLTSAPWPDVWLEALSGMTGQ